MRRVVGLALGLMIVPCTVQAQELRLGPEELRSAQTASRAVLGSQRNVRESIDDLGLADVENLLVALRASVRRARSSRGPAGVAALQSLLGRLDQLAQRRADLEAGVASLRSPLARRTARGAIAKLAEIEGELRAAVAAPQRQRRLLLATWALRLRTVTRGFGLGAAAEVPDPTLTIQRPDGPVLTHVQSRSNR